MLLKVRVLSTGRVEDVEVQKSSGFKLLDEEAKATVRTWQFTPSKRGSNNIRRSRRNAIKRRNALQC